MNDSAEYMFCGGNADPNDRSLDCTVVAVDGEIVAWLEQRARKSRSQNMCVTGRRVFPTVHAPAFADGRLELRLRV